MGLNVAGRDPAVLRRRANRRDRTNKQARLLLPHLTDAEFASGAGDDAPKKLGAPND